MEYRLCDSRKMILRTGHPIADTVADELERGIDGISGRLYKTYGYGILRGNAEIFKSCEAKGEDWFEIDRGYFRPGHFDGYYRVSYRGTQQTIGLDILEPDYERLDALNIQIEHPKKNDGHILVVPPTGPVKQFFNVHNWAALTKWNDRVVWRHKGDVTPLDEHLKNCRKVITFNSSIGWEALRRGIPVYSDPYHSIIGAYEKLIDKPLFSDFKERKKLFAIMCSSQFTLSEIRDGKACKLIDHYKSIADGTHGKPYAAMSQPTPSPAAHNHQ